MRRIFFYLTTAFVFLLFPAIASAASYYVNPSATGSKTGADWTNAYTSLPTTLVRGSTYYLADGSYSSYTFDDAESGSSWIYLKKATKDDHGTSTGWQDSMGDGTAVFSATLTFKTGYYDIDGAVGGGPSSWTSGHGIKVQMTGASSTVKVVKIENVSNLKFSHMDMGFTECSSCTGQDVIYGISGGSNWSFTNNYMHHASRVILYTINVSNITIDGTMLERSGVNPSSSQHSEIWSARDTHNVVLKNSYIKDWVSTGGIIMGRADNWAIYGNIFHWSKDWGATSNNGAIGSWSSDTTYYASNVYIYNNTFVGLKNGGSGKLYPIYNKISNVYAYNNVWYDSAKTGFGSGVTHDYNWFYNSGESSISETNKETGSGDPFTASSSYNFRLKTATKAGKSLSSPYNVDADGNVRGSDGTWDKGAYEFGGTSNGGPKAVPMSPTNLREVK